MIYRIIDSKIARTIAAYAFALALLWNVTQSAVSKAREAFGADLIAHGPTLPPDPWAGTENIVHGPTLPPDPWAGTENVVAHGPTLPPDPWAGTENVAPSRPAAV
jgi:hypothetical protein